ncbi:MAG: radical SAM protein [Candidatus Zixiibacteriota bacterium]
MSDTNKRVPDIVGWEITRQCNLRCAHCFTAATRRPVGELTDDECRAIIDAMAEVGVKMIGWTGGEPLLRKDLEELTEYAWSRNVRSNITTNGVLLNEERAERLIAAGCHTVQISLDGSTPEMNRRIRGATNSDYHRIVDAIRICKRLGARVVMASLVGRENLDDARRMIAFGKHEGVDTIRFCGFTPIGRGKQKQVKRRLQFSDELCDLLAFVKEAQEDDDILVTFDVGFGPVPPDYGFHKCIAGIETFYLKASGDVYPCTALAFPQFLVGNVREQPLQDLWQSPRMLAMAEFLRDQIDGFCSTCDNFANCRGACRGSTLAHTGNLHASFPMCLYPVETISPRQP